jgi:hypothetical protein
MSISVVAGSLKKICGSSLSGITGSNTAGAYVLCRQVGVPTSGRSLVQRSPTGCGVSECGLETSTKRMLRPTMAVEP